MPNRTTLGIDYSISTVYLAIVGEGKVWHTASIKVPSNAYADDRYEFFKHLKTFFDDAREAYCAQEFVYLEKPWVNNSRNSYTGLQMVRMATYIEIALISLKYEPCFVMPDVWRKAVYGKARLPDKKEAARDFVREKFGFETKYKYEHNICESILIAHYGEELEINEATS